MNRHGSLNRIYRLVWSQVSNSWVAVAESAKGRGKGKNKKQKLIAAALALSTVAWLIPEAVAGPGLNKVAQGSAVVKQKGATTTITQATQNVVLDWNSFNVASNETVNFMQPNASAVAVNDILGNSASAILGHVNANGEIFLINPNGVLFGKSAQVNVGGLVASALGTTDGMYFSGSGSVVNDGSITAGKFVVLLGSSVTNTGTITAPLGTIMLGAGNSATLTLNNGSPVSLKIDAGTLQNMVSNGGVIQADGGTIVLTAGAKDALLASVVNNTGVIEARTVQNHNGSIALLAGMAAGTVNVGGTLDASAMNGGDGGAIITNAAHVAIAPDAVVTTLAPQGKTGSWLIDPTDFTIAASGGDETGAQLSTALGSSNVTIDSNNGATGTAGNINVNDVVSWSASTLTLAAQNNININQPMNGSGTAGLALQYGLASANGTGSAININAPVNLASTGSFSTRQGSSGAAVNYTIITSLGAQGSVTGTDLQGMVANTAGDFVLGSNIDASATSTWSGGFVPIGSFSTTLFTGQFNGLEHTISNLTINQPASNAVGLFGAASSGAVISNVSLVLPNVTGLANTGPLVGFNLAGAISNVSVIGGTVSGGGYTGGLAGANDGTINSSSSSAAVQGSGNHTGGLAGGNGNSISNSYATGVVQGANYTGGLVGLTSGSVSNSYSTGQVGGTTSVGGLVGYMQGGSISNSYSSSVTSGSNNVGGLVGNANLGSISYAYALGTVTGTDHVGGLIGNAVALTVSNTYATGLVAGPGTNGGLIAAGGSNTVSSSYWNTDTTKQASSLGGTPLTAVQMQSIASFAGFNYGSGAAWVMIDADGSLNNAGGITGATYPMLTSEYATTITNAHQLQLMDMALSASYTLAANINANNTGAAGSDIWSSAGGFAPIGNLSTPFTGSLNGAGNAVFGLTMNWPQSNFVGLFGVLGAGSTVSNLSVNSASIAGSSYVGALAGYGKQTEINNSSSSGSVTGSANVGGLVGTTGYSSITNSHASGNVTAGGNNVGGLVGAGTYGAFTNTYASGAVSGGTGVGGLVGTLGNSMSVSNSYATGSVTGSGAEIGGLVGLNLSSISTSYASGAVTETQFSQVGGAGGLVGLNSYGTITNTYATGNVTGMSVQGGLVGFLHGGSINNSYSTGQVSGSGSVHGLVGVLQGSGSTNNSFWDINTSGQNTSYGGTGLTTAQMQTSLDFLSVGWDLTNTWIVYNGNTYPLLRAFMTPLTITANNQSMTYNGMAYTGANSITPATLPAAHIDGTLAYGGAWQGAVNAGSYSIIPFGLYSDQQGYALQFVNGTLTITPSALTVSGETAANKVYDGSTAATLSGGTLVGVIGSDSVTLTQAGNFVTANAGSGIAVTAADTLSGAAAGNYMLTQPNGLSANITQAPLTVTGQVANNKVYDGTTNATFTGGTLNGLISSDSGKVSLTDSGYFATANVGNNIAVTATDTISGSAAANYMLIEPTGLFANITPATLTLTVSNEAVAPKFYNGSTAATLFNGTLVGVKAGDTVTLNQSGYFTSANADIFASKTASCMGISGISCVPIPVVATDTLSGKSAGNYTLTEPTGLSGYIVPVPLVASGTAQNKVYDSTTAAVLSGATLTDFIPGVGVVAGQSVTPVESGTFASANVGKWTVTVNDSLSFGAGTLASNYFLLDPIFTTTASITPATLTYVATGVYITPGTKLPTLSGTLRGFVGTDTQANATTGTLKWTAGTSSTKTAGFYSIDGSGLTADHGNYVFVQAADPGVAPGSNGSTGFGAKTGNNSTALCIESSVSSCTAAHSFLQVAPDYRVVDTVNQEQTGTWIQTVLDSDQTQSAPLKARMPGVQVRDGGVKLPPGWMAMN